MSRFHSYISTATEILRTFDGKKPFVYHVKNFFSGHKKYGSRDRRTITSLCYAYFRLGHALKNASIEDRILSGLFLSSTEKNELLESLRTDLHRRITLPVSDKLDVLNFDYTDVFPPINELSDEIDKEKFIFSFFIQPDLFLRARPGKMGKVIASLSAAGLAFEKTDDRCIRLENASAIDAVVKLNEDAVIQDYSSQKVLDFLEENERRLPADGKIAAWDCCAASGGKSILLNDILNAPVQLTVSDIRENILYNLVKRLKEAGIRVHEKFVADLSDDLPHLENRKFHLIICDAPCTGSGTWSRTPEQLYYFDERSIARYAERQKKILEHVIPRLEQNGLLFYITCSVFEKENEEVVAHVQANFRVPLLHTGYIKGYDLKADTLFVAVFSA